MPDAPRDPPDPATAGARRRSGRSHPACLFAYLTESELAHARALAEDRRLSLSELTRRAVLGLRLPRVPHVNLQAWAKLGPLAGSLNRYLKAIDQGRAGDAPLALLFEIRQLLDLLRHDLLSGAPGDGAERR